MCELTTLWKDRSNPVALKMRLVKTLVWTVLSYGAEAWTLKVRDERKITSMVVLVRYSVYRSIVILVNVRYLYLMVSRYFDISNDQTILNDVPSREEE